MCAWTGALKECRVWLLGKKKLRRIVAFCFSLRFIARKGTYGYWNHRQVGIYLRFDAWYWPCKSLIILFSDSATCVIFNDTNINFFSQLPASTQSLVPR